MIFPVPRLDPERHKRSQLVGTVLARAETASLFLKPLVGVVQVVATVAVSHLIAFAAPVEVPPGDISLFSLKPQAGIVRPEPAPVKRSVLISAPLGIVAPAAVDVRFQRPFTSIARAPVVPSPSRIVSIRPADEVIVPDLFFLQNLQPRRAPIEKREAFPESELVFALETEPFSHFLVPQQGKPQFDPEIREVRTRFTGPYPPDIIAAPIDVLFQRPLVQPLEIQVYVAPIQRLIAPTAADAPATPLDIRFQRPRQGFEQPLGNFVVLPGKFVIVIPPDIPPTPINVLFQRAITGIERPGDVLPPTHVIRVPSADELRRRVIRRNWFRSGG